MIRRPPRSTQSRSSAASDVYKRQVHGVSVDLDKNLYFNLCNRLERECNSRHSFGIVANSERPSECNLVTTGQNVINDQTIQLLDNNQPQGGVVFKYNPGDEFALNEKYSLEVELECDRDSHQMVLDKLKSHLIAPHYRLRYKTNQACPTHNIYLILNFIQENRVIFVIVAIIFGIIECFYGKKLFKPTLFLLGFTIFTVLSLVFFFQFALSKAPTDTIKWVLVGISVLIGTIFGWLAVKFSKLGMFLGGAFLGFVLASVLYNTIIYRIALHQPDLALYLTIVICMISLGVLAFYATNHIIILATSFGGSFIAAKGVSLFAGSFPNLFEIAKMIQNDQVNDIPNSAYIYIACFMLVGLIGSVYQYMEFKKSKELEKERDIYNKLHDYESV
eukprot:TRINITY_DN8909_c0_g1_i1.p2 TRINITY_DN8909_c0_g1~~TRINITY_DN8909_c0_g1_i1.p2  ORF type:complete len:390 (+),score=76.87 TRINITY_DN8909_c0_g1_i1:27-1196(+)